MQIIVVLLQQIIFIYLLKIKMLLHYKSASSAFGVLGETSARIATPTLISR
jgi:hypothetical protein